MSRFVRVHSSVAGALICLLTQSCALLMTQKAPERYAWDDIDYSNCTTNKAPVYVDALFAGLGLGSVLVGNPAGFIDLAVFGGSALYGSTEVDSCEKFQAHKIAQKKRQQQPVATTMPQWMQKPAAQPPAAMPGEGFTALEGSANRTPATLRGYEEQCGKVGGVFSLDGDSAICKCPVRGYTVNPFSEECGRTITPKSSPSE